MSLPSCSLYISRMMGLNEEPGIIPRFCEDLFAQVAKRQTSEVCLNSNHDRARPPRPVTRSERWRSRLQIILLRCSMGGRGRRFQMQKQLLPVGVVEV